MKNLCAVTAAAMGLTATALVVAGPVSAAPTGPSTVDDTVNALKADGYHVILNRTGAKPLSQCAVASVRPGQEFTRTDTGNTSDSLVTTVISKTVLVEVEC